MSNYKVLWEIAKNHTHDASGVIHPENWLWQKEDGVYYPAQAKFLGNLSATSQAEAQKKAEQLVFKCKHNPHTNDNLQGDWQPRIWFNTHWCYSAQLGTLEVFENETKIGDGVEVTYTCHMGDDVDVRGGGTPNYWGGYLKEKSATPYEAIQLALGSAREFLENIEEVVKLNEEKVHEIVGKLHKDQTDPELSSMLSTDVNDYLKANCRSWERDCDDLESTTELASHLHLKYPDVPYDNLYEIAKDWTGYKGGER